MWRQTILSPMARIAQLCLCHGNPSVHERLSQLDLAPSQPVHSPSTPLEPLQLIGQQKPLHCYDDIRNLSS
jgi:hypothetical protein